MKKVLAITLCLLMCLSLFSCTQADYNYAIKLYESGDYKTALDFFNVTKKYKDSAEKLTECKYYLAKMAIDNEFWEDATDYLLGLNYLDSEELLKECYMHTNLDYAFLEEVNKLVHFRLYEAEGKEVTQKELARTEYSQIVKYELEDFFDANLKEISLALTEGLKLRVQALDEEKLNSSQAKLYQAEFRVADALTRLHDEYDLMPDDESFKTAFLDVRDDYETTAEASLVIQKDLEDQFKKLNVTTGTPFKKEYNYLKLTVKNNTDYQYNLTVTVNFIDKTGVTYETAEIQRVMKKKNGDKIDSYTFNFRINSTSIYQTLSFDYSYKDIAK
ncbi:MAG: hypothetical protein MJ171_07005 [Clostridia bacterium]|nr:hypothetical protein [Clostridia bacterium]